MTEAPLLKVDDLAVHFQLRTGGFSLTGPRRSWRALKAVDGVSFTLKAGETLGIVGESGCGKSTLGRAVLRLIEPTSGHVAWLGQDFLDLDPADLRAERKSVQIIFQDPLASLNPRMTIGSIIAEPLITHEPNLSKADVEARVRGIMDETGLLPAMINRYPHEFSGGSVPARRHRARDDPPAETDRLRRARLRPRCLDPGPDHQSPDAPAAGLRPVPPVHQP